MLDFISFLHVKNVENPYLVGLKYENIHMASMASVYTCPSFLLHTSRADTISGNNSIFVK